MVCPEEHLLDNTEYLRQFRAKVRRRRIPLHGSLDLTYRCNLRCVHCYAVPASTRGEKERGELTTSQVCSIIDQAADAGCLFFMISGGEPLMRDDFPDVYRHAKERGLYVTVFTNGTRVDDKIVSLFEEFPPLGVEISIYGERADTHDRVTGVRGSHDLSMRAIALLTGRGVRVVLKTILMTINKDELAGMEALARRLGLKFRFDAMIFPRLDRSEAPLRVRVSPDEAVSAEFSDPDRVASWRKYAAQFSRTPQDTDVLYTCGTGINCFHVDPYGSLYPCLMARSVGYNVATGTFRDGWENAMPRIREEKVPPGYACNACDLKLYCSACPAAFQLEEGMKGSYYDFRCAVARKRSEVILRSA